MFIEKVTQINGKVVPKYAIVSKYDAPLTFGSKCNHLYPKRNTAKQVQKSIYVDIS